MSIEHVYAEGTPDVIDGEERWKVYGSTLAGRLLTVVFAMITEVSVRIVTAYDMDAGERREYFQGIGNE
jgi:uncharacterized DUF497 family protein